ncbi:hypothetical protein J2W97_001326 [Paenibacillus jamilae]|nr:hypothetical protein [Paenibacillus jamilae]
MASIKIINKQTGRENRHLTHNFMKAIDNNLKITLPEKFKISIQ